MNKKVTVVLLGCAALASFVGGLLADDQLDDATKARIERFEKGPATVNVSSYPQSIQDNYALFSQKCSQCHRLSRPINSDYVLPDEWARYIKRMMYKPGSNISADDAKKIYDFLVYDSSIRKKSTFDSKLQALPPDDRQKAQDKLKEVVSRNQ